MCPAHSSRLRPAFAFAVAVASQSHASSTASGRGLSLSVQPQYIVNMVASPTSNVRIKLGALVELTNDNNTHNTKGGQWLVIQAVSADGKKVDAAVFATKAEAAHSNETSLMIVCWGKLVTQRQVRKFGPKGKIRKDPR